MAVDFTADLAAIYADAGVPVVFGAQSTYGFFDRADEIEGEDGATYYGKAYQVRIVTGTLTGVVDGSALTVGGTAYRARTEPLRQEPDGAESIIYLAES